MMRALAQIIALGIAAAIAALELLVMLVGLVLWPFQSAWRAYLWWNRMTSKRKAL
jgi:hypothetical protein